MKIPDLPSDKVLMLGVGIDIVASARVSRMLETHGGRFLSRLFTTSEVDFCMRQPAKVPELAVRLAAKEACFKAIGGRRGMGLGWRDFEVMMAHDGVPYIELRGNGLERGNKIGVRKIFLSLTHEDEWSGAVVIMTG